MKSFFNVIFMIAVMVGACHVAVAETVVPQTMQQMQMSFSPLVKKTSPAVVNIYTKHKVKQRGRRGGALFADPFFNRFFGQRLRSGPVRERLVNSLGSGVIVDAHGIVATNYHVVKAATEITVVTADGREFEAKTILADEKVDLAILKIETKGVVLPYLSFTDSDAVEVGDIVLAIGNPFGVGQTVTSGIISGLARTSVPGVDYGFFMQTDAAINPGNSGGALVNMQGRLVGINTSIFSKDGGSLGIGFAIPSNMVHTVVATAKNGGNKIVRPWSGMGSQDVTPDMIESLGLPRAYGTLVTNIVPNAPADKAGIKTGDVVLMIDGKEIQGASALRFRLATVKVGDTVVLKVWRKGKKIDIKMVTAPAPETVPRNVTKIEGNNPLSGAVVANISPALKEDVASVSADEGVVVIRMEFGYVSRLGLREGDVVLFVNDKKVDSVKTLKKILSAETRAWKLQILRGERKINMTISG